MQPIMTRDEENPTNENENTIRTDTLYLEDWLGDVRRAAGYGAISGMVGAICLAKIPGYTDNTQATSAMMGAAGAALLEAVSSPFGKKLEGGIITKGLNRVGIFGHPVSRLTIMGTAGGIGCMITGNIDGISIAKSMANTASGSFILLMPSVFLLIVSLMLHAKQLFSQRSRPLVTVSHHLDTDRDRDTNPVMDMNPVMAPNQV